MKCRYCNIALAPLRSLTDGEFCCDDHRYAFHEEQAAPIEVSLEPPLQGALFPLTVTLPWESPDALPAPIWKAEPKEFKAVVAKPASSLLSPWTESAEPDPPVWEQVLPLRFSATPADSDTGCTEELPGDLEFPGIIALPRCVLDPVSIPVEPKFEQPEPVAAPAPVVAAGVEPEPISEEAPRVLTQPYREVANSWHWLRDAWKNAPTDLKVVTILLPILLAVAVGPAMPKIKARLGPLASLPSLHSVPSLHS